MVSLVDVRQPEIERGSSCKFVAGGDRTEVVNKGESAPIRQP